jgi:hypothetical protein
MNKICKNCGFRGEPLKKGSGWIEFLLYFVYFIPGIFYSVWRREENGRVKCPSCGSCSMIPTSSPTGRELFEKYHAA